MYQRECDEKSHWKMSVLASAYKRNVKIFDNFHKDIFNSLSQMMTSLMIQCNNWESSHKALPRKFNEFRCNPMYFFYIKSINISAFKVTSENKIGNSLHCVWKLHIFMAYNQCKFYSRMNFINFLWFIHFLKEIN